MGRQRARGRASSPNVLAGLLLLPVTLVRLIAGLIAFALRFRLIRTASYVVGAAVLLLIVEEVLLARALGRSPGTIRFAALVVVYGTSIWLLLNVWRRYEGRRRLRVKRFESLLALTPVQFEFEVGRLLKDLGYRNVKRVGGAGDLAADLRCRDRDGRSVVVQCKRYAPGRRVASGDVQAFIGMIAVHHRADRGIFVTTAEFTQPATQLAHEHGITLYDGTLLARLVRDINAGQRVPAVLRSGG